MSSGFAHRTICSLSLFNQFAERWRHNTTAQERKKLCFTKNRKELQIIFGFVITASAQLNRTKEDRYTGNGTSTPMMNINQNAIGAKIVDIVRSTKFFKKTNKKEKTNYETQ